MLIYLAEEKEGIPAARRSLPNFIKPPMNDFLSRHHDVEAFLDCNSTQGIGGHPIT